jgi:hypothetical protein
MVTKNQQAVAIEATSMCGQSALSVIPRWCLQFLALFAAACVLFATPVRAADVMQQKYPDVIAAKVRASGTDRFDFDVTISSPYDTPQRYADAFRVTGKDGAVYGERILLHDHANEQPFTRDLYGVKIPPVSALSWSRPEISASATAASPSRSPCLGDRR